MECLEVILLNDNPGPLEAFEIIFRHLFENVSVTGYLDPREARCRINEQVPDLLVTSDRMPGLRGEEIVKELLGRKAGCAVIVTSTFEATGEWVRELRDRGERIAYVALPCTVEDLREALRAVGCGQPPRAKVVGADGKRLT
jgi:DNA-binding NtrC family response regulator